MVCENCGKELKTLTTFCPYCGALVKAEEKSVLAPLPGQTIPPIKIAESESDTKNENDVHYTSADNERVNFANNGNFANNEQNTPVASPYSYGMEGTIPQPVKKDNAWAGIVSLVMGILSVLSCGAGTLVVILAIVFGCIGLKSSKRKLSIAGIVLAVISVIIFVALVAMIFLGFWSAMPLIDETVLNGVFSL